MAEAMPTDHRAKLAAIKRFDQLIAYLRDEMDWPIENGSSFEDLTFEYLPDELGLDAKTAAKIQEIKRLRPLSPKQPWGIFFVKFEPKRLPVVALRRILGQVALKKRASANSAERAAWAADDLLFVSNYGEGDERQICFAHFARAQDGHDLPTLKVLGWDNSDTALHLDAVARELTEHLAWPDDDANAEAWRARWSAAFTLGHREVVTTSKELSARLAELARAIRDRIKTAIAIETDKGPLTRLMRAFQTSLVHDLDADGFADMYAQTIAYGLLSARIADPSKKTADDFAAHMRTNPFLRELMETFLKFGGRKGKAGGQGKNDGIDFDELGVSEVVELLDAANMEAVVRDFGDRNPQEDPVIHFYELFLKEYDAKKRMSRGVFYTPRPVVSYIVRSVDELLRTKFGLKDGLADTTTWGEMAQRHDDVTIPEGISPDQDFVQILDPATGTGTFVVEIIEVIHKHLVAKWKLQGHGDKKIDALWNEYVPKHLLTRIYGYEIMMAPFAIAHLKVGLKLYETGYRFASEERARIYLTDSLEPEQDFSERLEFSIPALAHEAAAVNAVKRYVPFTVLVGNPPYLREKERGPGDRATRIGGWVRFGNDDMTSKTLFDDFISPLSEERQGVHAKLAYELSVIFWRFALWTVFERKSSFGVIGMISPRAYIAGPGHLGMRRWMRSHAASLHITDLGGDNRGARKSENIFEIETGVAIGLCANPPGRALSACRVRYAELDGDAEQKLANLFKAVSIDSIKWIDCATEGDSLSPDVAGPYAKWPKLTDLFPWQHSGVQFKRLWPIAESAEVLELRWRRLLSLAPADRGRAFIETDARLVARGTPGRSSRRNTGIAELPASASLPAMQRYCYRALDRQWAFIDERFADRLRPTLAATLGPKQVFAMTLMSKQLGRGPSVTVTNLLPDMDAFCNRGAKDVIPLWRDNGATEPNVTSGLLSQLESRLMAAVSPEDLLCYCVAILASPSYAERFERELAIPGPRIPITTDARLFQRGCLLGAEFIWLQTFGQRWLAKRPAPCASLSGSACIAQEIPPSAACYPEEFGFDPQSKTLRVGTGLIAGVFPEVYGYSQSGFKPVESWLRYRMKERGGRARKESARSELDTIRPAAWSFSSELLELLWTIEGCIRLWPALHAFQQDVVGGDCILASQLPEPTDADREEPKEPSSQGMLGFG